VLRSVLLELMRETPRDLIAHELWGRAANAAAGWAASRAYAASAATNSMVGYVVGLGDRHLDNVLLDLSSGELLHIDYNVCFEKGLRLKVAETVPFRMTPAMVSALGPWGVDGPFTSACEAVLRVLRSAREPILALLEAFVYEPLAEWGADRLLHEQRREAEVSVSLTLAASRVDELVAPPAHWRAELSPAVGRLTTAIGPVRRTLSRAQRSSLNITSCAACSSPAS